MGDVYRHLCKCFPQTYTEQEVLPKEVGRHHHRSARSDSKDHRSRNAENVLPSLKEGEHQSTSDVIAEQYQPVPKTKPGLAVSLADRLDSLVGLFAAGMAPTGTRDPFALRRAAIGVVQPLIEHNLDFDLQMALRSAASLQPIPVNDEVLGQVLEFITGRLRVVLMDMDYGHDVVDAVLAAQASNPAGAARAVKQFSAWVKRKDWNTILPAYARCVRITRDQEKKFKLKPEGLVEAEEKTLYTALQKAEKLERAAGSADDFLNAFVPMIPAVDAFFEKVMVMTEDRIIQENRLGLLQRIATLAAGVADLSKLEGF